MKGFEGPEETSLRGRSHEMQGLVSFNASFHTNCLMGSVVFFQLAIKDPSVVNSTAVALPSNCVNGV